VDGYRRTTLAGELARARVALEAAGVHADLQVPARALPLDVEEALAWVVREGVTNVVRHSGARACRLCIDVHDGTARLTLDDDGRSTSPTEPGGGLTGMRQRLETVDGTLVTTRDDDGFALVATVPVPVLDDTDIARATEQA
jgi:two-component system sensor histidine kinase DesK